MHSWELGNNRGNRLWLMMWAYLVVFLERKHSVLERNTGWSYSGIWTGRDQTKMFIYFYFIILSLDSNGDCTSKFLSVPVTV